MGQGKRNYRQADSVIAKAVLPSETQLTNLGVMNSGFFCTSKSIGMCALNHMSQHKSEKDVSYLWPKRE